MFNGKKKKKISGMMILLSQNKLMFADIHGLAR
jgi:hypothetical protein